MALISRRTFAPGGWQFFQPQTQWPKDQSAFSGKTFDEVVAMIAAHRRANPRFNLTTDEEAIGNELDLFTCVRLANNPAYCSGVGPPKAPRSPSAPRVAGSLFGAIGRSAGVIAEKTVKYVSGIGVLLAWLGSGGKAVSQELAESRAAVCATCPKNEPGGLDSFFTAIAAEKIRSQLALRNEMEMRTSQDSKLNVCTACLCQTKLKVHVPIEHVLARLKPEMKEQLDPRCWIRSEKK